MLVVKRCETQEVGLVEGLDVAGLDGWLDDSFRGWMEKTDDAQPSSPKVIAAPI